MIPKSFIQDLLNRIDIVDVIGRYLPLKKAGANFVACCPFHNEKSPSFTVSPTKQFYHCFGCGAHGTAIGFVMEHGGLGFVDAVEELARGIGLSVPHEKSGPGQAPPKVGADLYELMQTASRYYRAQLKQSPRAIDYLKRRGLSGEIAARFGLGYAPDGWQNLEHAVPDYQDKSLVETGLVIVKDDEAPANGTPPDARPARGPGTGRRYDRFRDRIMFPIVNQRGQIIGFGGRVLDKGEPKYLNSPETPLFEKGRELYGLFQAQKAIRAEGLVLVVEGYMDVVALAQLGVEYAVATLGTATTPYHVQKLLRMTDQVVFCFDGDAAGRRAAWRALENSLPHLQDGKQLRFLFLPPEHDPDSYIREYGKEAFERLLGEEAVPLSGYLLRELSSRVDMKTQEGRSAFLENAKPLLTAITAPATGLLLRKEAAALAGITQAELEGLYAIKPVTTTTPGAAGPARPAPAPQRAARRGPSGNQMFVRCLLAKPELARDLPLEWPSESEEAALIAALAGFLREQGYAASTAAIIQQFQGTPFEAALTAAQAVIMQWGEGFDIEAEFNGMLGNMRKEARKQEAQALLAKAGGSVQRMSAEEKARYLQLTQVGTG